MDGLWWGGDGSSIARFLLGAAIKAIVSRPSTVTVIVR